MPDTYNCNVCGWPCGNSDNLAQHMRIHTSHEQYQGPGGWITTYDDSGAAQTCCLLSEFSEFDNESIFGETTMTRTQHIEHPSGTTTTVSAVTSPRGTAIVTTIQHTKSSITTAVSQASGTVTSLGLKQKQDHDNNCVLCLESLSAEETMTTLCNHTFHNNCLLELSKKSNSRTPNGFPCPICRQAITYVWFNSKYTS